MYKHYLFNSVVEALTICFGCTFNCCGVLWLYWYWCLLRVSLGVRLWVVVTTLKLSGLN